MPGFPTIAPRLAVLVGAALAELLTPACAVAADSAATLPVPTSEQVAWHDAEVGLFFHWAPNVYQGGEGDDRSTPRDRINPDRFDADQWAGAVQAAGAKYMIFVAKHVGGYCAWQTKTTDYSLTTSPWKQGRGDMVGELARACQARGLKFGVYLSPLDKTHGAGVSGRMPSPEKQASYDEIYRRQLTEILTGYGPMFEMWFDGGNIVPINDLIDAHAPGIIAYHGRRRGGSRWVGNEHGFAPYPCWNTVPWREGESPPWGAGTPEGNLWCPAECDVSLIRPRWFWSPGSDAAILSLDALVEIYYLSVGRGVNLLLNVAPDDHGEVPAAQLRRLGEFGAEIRARFATPLGRTKGDGAEVVLDLGGERTIDHVVVREDIRGGERVRKFLVEGRRATGRWVALARGSQIGNRQIIPIPASALTAVRLTVQESVAPATIRELSVFHVDRPVPKLAFRDGGLVAMRAPGVSRSRDGYVAIESPTPDWEIRYTLDGTEPTRESPRYLEPQGIPIGAVLTARYFETGDPAHAGGPVTTRRFGLAASQITVVRASSEEPESPAAAAFDGDPTRMWHTAWRKGIAAPPHEIVVDLGTPRSVTGLGYLARQDAVGNVPSGVRIWVGETADAFPPQPQFEGNFVGTSADPHAWRHADFPQPVRGRYLRIVYPNEANDTQCVASAELEVMVATEKPTAP